MAYNMTPAVKNYEWGKMGLDSTVARLVEGSGEGVQADQPYAELWMGTHPNGPARVVLNGKLCPLSKLLKQKPEVLSSDANKATEGLPYLFKILSIGKALSIQAHPDKEFAAQLHEKFPDIYKDANHKPEMALALTDFEALVGFRPFEEIFDACQRVGELNELLEEVLKSDEFKFGEEKYKLQMIFESLMNADPKRVRKELNKLEMRLTENFPDTKLSKLNKPWNQIKEKKPVFLDRLALRLLHYYPGDVGVFCAYMLNYVLLKPGEAIFLGANEPHAYLQGDCAEIMANSDNVVRAGLTPKLRDVPTLCSMMTYEPFDATGNVMAGIAVADNVKRYRPNDESVDEFEMERGIIEPQQTLNLEEPNFGSVLLILEGTGVLTVGEEYEVEMASVFFQSAGSMANLRNSSDDKQLVFIRATKKFGFNSK